MNREERRVARARRRALGAFLLVLPALILVAMDLMLRVKHLLTFDGLHWLGYVASVLASTVFWAVLLHAAARRNRLRGHLSFVLFVSLFAIVVGVEASFFRLYGIYLSIDGQIHSKSIPWSVLGHLPLDWPDVWGMFAVALATALALGLSARRYVRPSPIPRALTWILIPLCVAALTQATVSFRSIQSTSPDLIYFHGLISVIKEHLGLTHESPDLRVQRRTPELVPRLTANPSRPRNIVLLLQESLRADVTCVKYDPACEEANQFTNALLPTRFALKQLRSNASTTAISISNLWSGVAPTESRELLHAVPLIWDYARAAGYDTAYWTSQNSMFGNTRLYIQDIDVAHKCVATNLDAYADLDTGANDALLSEHVIQEWDSLKEPFLAVVHYSNVHYPYVYDENFAPFQPSEFSKAPEANEAFKNYYKNVAYLSDKAVGRLVERIRSSPQGARTVLVYTSDHGESFREHWQMGHTSSLYDEEILVPGFIDAPEGTLSPEERASLGSAEDDFVWHLDLATTMFDLLGIWDDPNFQRFRVRMPGHPITRPERTVAPVPLTNCSWLWGCEFRNWGMMLGPMKLEAREWDGEFHCFNVLSDPYEITNLGEAACAPLPDLARRLYHVMPDVTPPGRKHVNWGSH